MTNYEAGTRIPLLIRAPWVKGSAGRVAWSLAEAVDIAPTLWDLAGVGLPDPTTPGGAHLGGVSLRPAMATGAEVKTVALSQFPRCWQNNTNHEPVRPGYGPGDEHNLTVSWMSMSDCHWMRREDLDYMGYSLRTDSPFPLRFVLWLKWHPTQAHPTGEPDWNTVVGTELYNHSASDLAGKQGAPIIDYLDSTENENLAANDDHASLITELTKTLRRTVEKWLV